MDKKVIIAAGIVVVAGILAIFVLRRPEKGLRKSTPHHPFPKLKVDVPKDPKVLKTWESPLKARIDKIEISQKGKTIVLARLEKGKKKNDVGKWEMKSPVKYPANEFHIRSLINRFERLEFWEVITSDSGEYTSLNVDEKTGTRLRIFSGDEVLGDMIVGKTITSKGAHGSGSYTAVRPYNAKDVWKMGGSVSYIFSRSLDKWRDDSIIKEKRDRLAAISIQGSDGSLLVAKRNTEETDRTKKYNNWELLRSSETLGSVDQSELGRVASSISSLRAAGFADEADPAKTGLDKPVRRIVAVFKKETPKPPKAEPKAGAATKPEAGADTKPAPAGTNPKKAEEKSKARPKAARPAAAPRSARPKAGRSPGRPAPTLAAARSAGRNAPGPRAAAGTAEARAGYDPQPMDPSSYGDPDVDRLSKDPGYVTYVLLVGAELSKEKTRYVKVEGKNQVFTIRSTTVASFLKKVIDFKDKTIFAVKPDDVVSIEVDKEGKKSVLVKEKGKWVLSEPKNIELDLPMVERTVKMLENRFKAREFSDTKDPKKTGLDKPKGKVVIRLKDKKVIELLIGNEQKRSHWYVQVKGADDVYVVSSYPLTQLYKEPEKWKKVVRKPGPMGPGGRRRRPPVSIRR